ncbi:MAG: nicotinate-nucleotide diphosphorylase (carboxylating) [Flavobacteriales bacterium CG03_land_8_20_14_0_80_35_15]|nr:carboxylating nicotinate-nucleotide diphosphorylase [Zetaproteobacteria bacterium]OIO10219.1 MAG: nicotinate-nucleotide diphosphorylase (carboxylating) [Flavobacteriaceae bacterium CG1_02_35_72]PIR14620.1 MAG: nicotinate-nucleotide diphosphorylase (carboxylating) [Flavobacteriales bacterium CG11_big_fil_rev_8_21_14_0_20_35_7]PIV16487.1 MAG: nicotinate-nucleotide diphosphorylase (carboxylating) [Flavobacteriales bacterium CG03_land_8_20_14_0_80_35_15]PJA06942.1 MAG: nicotinate-nucleotide diph
MQSKALKTLVDMAIAEDLGTGDITSEAIISNQIMVKAFLIAKAPGIIAGLPLADFIFSTIDKNCHFKALVKEGAHVEPKTKIAEVTGAYKSLLMAERTVLNFVQRFSGIATETALFVSQTKGTKTQILDTRKTLPAYRVLDKYAVKVGGGTNHRFGLYDMVMLKENHIEVAGGITNAVMQVRAKVNHNIKIEVETKNLEEVQEALSNGVDVIMLDNMPLDTMRKAVKLINGKLKVEASGNMTLNRIAEVAATGVDFISVGALTHSVDALDISMLIE